MKKAGLILALFSLMLPAMAQDKKLPYTLDDREMIIHLQGDVANLKDKAEALDKKVDAGFTRTDAGFADIKQQLNQQSNLFITSLFALFGASIGLIAVLIGYISMTDVPLPPLSWRQPNCFKNKWKTLKKD
jgi:hypothetical protein